MNRPRFQCPKCGRGTTKGRLEDDGMCGSCLRIWTRPSLDESLTLVTDAQKAAIFFLFLDGMSADRIAGRLKKEHPLPAPHEWSIPLVFMADELRRSEWKRDGGMPKAARAVLFPKKSRRSQ